MEVEERIERYIAKELMGPQGRDTEALTAHTELFRTGIIDSFGLLSLVQYLESEFRIRVRDEEMMPENFTSIASISHFVRSKQTK